MVVPLVEGGGKARERLAVARLVAGAPADVDMGPLLESLQAGDADVRLEAVPELARRG